VTWDDHEVDDDYAGALSEDDESIEAFRARRAYAYRAYYEHLPLRRGAPHTASLPIYRRLAYGRLAQFHVLDGRQYRSDQPCGNGYRPRCGAAHAEAATMLGAEQERWLLAGLDHSDARWNVLANQTRLAQAARNVGPFRVFRMDHWDGYAAARDRLVGFLHARRPENPVAITGDLHSNWVADLKRDFDDPDSPSVGTEFVGTSISSGGDGADMTPRGGRMLTENPHVRFFNEQRGYVRCQVTPETWQSDFQVMEYVSRPGASIRTRASFVVENGHPGAVRA
jgi:alkaline phosphatase D